MAHTHITLLQEQADPGAPHGSNGDDVTPPPRQPPARVPSGSGFAAVKAYRSDGPPAASPSPLTIGAVQLESADQPATPAAASK